MRTRTAASAGIALDTDRLSDATLVRRHGELLGRMPAEEIVAWAMDRWGNRLAICTSLQVTGTAIIDMAWRIDPRVRVITVDTGRLPQETHDLVERVRDRYGIEVEVLLPDPASVREMVRVAGPNLFRGSVEGRRRCCHARKVEPLRRAMADLDAWIAGLRRDQSPARSRTPKVQIDRANGGRVKLNPLADWSRDRVWSYVRDRGVPYHALYDRGYTSIGCAPCTRAIGPGEDRRAGRWWWEDAGTSKECGLHLPGSEEGR